MRYNITKYDLSAFAAHLRHKEKRAGTVDINGAIKYRPINNVI